jgi:hypothetical protein
MNERIEEFAELSGAVRYDFDTLDGTNLEELNKFAKLIIAECIAVHEDDYGIDIIGDVLKKHFGVELL